MLGGGHGGGAHAIAPEELVEDDGVGGVSMGKVEIAAFLPDGCVRFIEQAVVPIAVIGGEGGLRAGAGEERSHDGGAGIVGVHGRRGEERFDGANHIDGGVEVVIDERFPIGERQRRIFADQKRDAAVGIDVVGAVLGVVFEDEDGGVVPVRAMRNGIGDAADGEIIIGNGSGGTGLAFLAAGGVVIRQAKKDELRHGVFAGFAGRDKAVEFVQEFVGAELIGVGNFEIREERIEVIAKLNLRGDIFGEDGNVPGIGTGPAARVTNVFGKWVAFLDDGARAGNTFDHGRSGLGNLVGRRIAPFGDDEFAVVAIGNAVSGEILPEIAAGGFACVGQVVERGNAAE